MNDSTPIEHLKWWITSEGFPDWNLEEGLTYGTYGLVFFLRAMHANSSPSGLALKTLNPESLPENPTQLDEIQREFSKWIRLPDHFNVLSAFPFKIATVPLPDSSDPELTHSIQLPVIPMERMDGTLGDWVGQETFPLTAKLWALAQAFNGLDHLYCNGIEGHGDLKPSNILFKEVSLTQKIPSDTWLSECPWIIKIADLGWADAWVDYGYTNKSLREYIAPERLGTSPLVIPEKSDMFSMGIIAAELLTGIHPSLNLKAAKKSDGEWIKRAKRGDWNLDQIPTEHLKKIIQQCLEPSPEERPTAKEARDIICQELTELSGVDFKPVLDQWAKANTQEVLPYVSSRSEEIERLIQTLGLGKEEENKSTRRLRQILESINPDTIYSMEDWVQAASGLIDFLNASGTALNDLEVSKLRDQARIHVETTLGRLTNDSLTQPSSKIGEKDPITSFEHFGHLVGNLAHIAKIDFEQSRSGEWNLSPLAIGGFALHKASIARFESQPYRSPIEYLDIAIEHAPDQAAPYFFRALRRQELLPLAETRNSGPTGTTIEDVIADLEIACHNAPDWQEPRAELKNIRDQL